jgi:tRNA nucleotidyltransferase (CCA-adding enzyme)
MKDLAPLMDQLARERVFDELFKLIPFLHARDFQVYAPVLVQAVPALRPTLGFDQRNPHHIYDIYTHTAHVVEAAPLNWAVRWAALLHDCGKPACFSLDEQGVGHFYGHAKVSKEIAEATLLQLKAPTALRERVCLLIEQHMVPLEADKKFLRRRLGKFGEEAMMELVALQEADMTGTKGIPVTLSDVRACLAEILAEDACLTVKDLKITGKDLLDLGFKPGPALGDCLQWLLEQVQDEILPNEKQALLQKATERI